MSIELDSGIIVTLEGMDGCGKTTQARELVKRLRGLGLDVVHVKEPGGAVDADKVRRLLLEDLSDDVHPGVEVMLFMAAKIDLYQRVVKPALERGAVVVSERGWLSMFAYQGAVGGIDYKAMQRLRGWSDSLGGPPMGEIISLQILLRQSLETSYARIAERRQGLDHFESKPENFHRDVMEQFESDFHHSNNHPGDYTKNPYQERYDVIGVEERTVEDISDDVLRLVLDHITRTSLDGEGFQKAPSWLTADMYPNGKV